MQFRFGAQVIKVNVATKEALLDRVSKHFAQGTGFALATINLDHLVKLSRSDAFLKAYAAHDIVVADGNPIVWLSRVAGKPVALLPGSDLVVTLADLAAVSAHDIALIGSTEKALEKAAETLLARNQNLKISLKIAPAFGFDPEGAEAAEILSRLQTSDARLCFLALGAPKQEIFAARGRAICPGVGFVSIGAGLDFLSGDQVRAPHWIRKLTLEWLWRLAHNPVRLGPRYVRSVLILPGQAIAALRQRGG